MPSIDTFRVFVASKLGVDPETLKNNEVIQEYFNFWTEDNKDPMYIDMCADTLTCDF